jgi:ABC-type Mn2+/Zn2+ transport system ATPase subunit
MKLFGQNVRAIPALAANWISAPKRHGGGRELSGNRPGDSAGEPVFQNRTDAAGSEGNNKQNAHEALMLTGMADHGKELLFSQLSGGQQQRVLLAGMLAGDPAVMILDEPPRGLTPRASRTDGPLASLNKEKMVTVVMVTHDLKRASAYAGRTFCLEEGSLMELTRGRSGRSLSTGTITAREAPEQEEE